MEIIELLPVRKNTVVLRIAAADGTLCSESVMHNARVNAGAAAMVAQMFGTAAQPAAFNYVALSTSTASPAMGDAALTGEITSNGLARKQATFTYVTAPTALNGNAQATLTASWTATGSGTIGTIGALNASSGGTLGLETLVNGGVAVSYNATDTVSLVWNLSQ